MVDLGNSNSNQINQLLRSGPYLYNITNVGNNFYSLPKFDNTWKLKYRTLSIHIENISTIETREPNTSLNALHLKPVLDQPRKTQHNNFRIIAEILGNTITQFWGDIKFIILDLELTNQSEKLNSGNRLK